MADFNELWDADNPSDSTNANEIDDYENNLRAMIAERLQDMVYGFTSGEDTDAPGFKKITALVQASAPSTPTNAIELYGYDVSSKCELHAKDEDGDVVQLTAGGNIGGANVELLAGKDLLGSATSDITINTDKFTVAGATGNTAIAGTLGVTGVATLGDTSALATSAAPTADAQIANKKYADDLTTMVPAVSGAGAGYAGEESITFQNGLILKTGKESSVAQGDTTVTFGDAFPNALISVLLTMDTTVDHTTPPHTKTQGTSSFVIDQPNGGTAPNIDWIAIGY